jgi:hypothetical protein
MPGHLEIGMVDECVAVPLVFAYLWSAAYILINSAVSNANKELVNLYRIVIVKDMKTMKTESSFSNEIVQQHIPHARMSSIRFLLLFLLILVAFCN